MANTYLEVFEVEFADGAKVACHTPGWNLNSLEAPVTSERTEVTGRGRSRVLDPTEVKDTTVSFQVKWVTPGTDVFRGRQGESVTWRRGPYGNEDGEAKYSASGFIQAVQRIVADNIWHLTVTIECTSAVALGTWQGGA